MAETKPADDPATKFVKQNYKDMKPEELPWYSAELKELEPLAQELFEKYCGLPPDDVKSHIKQQRDKAFKIHPYPCLGRWGFLDLSIAAAKEYPEIIQRIKNGQRYLDIGCCVGQDIRKLVHDGAPSENTFGSDLHKDFIDIGYDLFMDKESLKTTFIAADIFDTESDLKQLEGTIDIVHAASFLHLFPLDRMTEAATRMAKMLKDKPGCLVVGRQLGNVDHGHTAGTFDETKNRFRHNVESFDAMWKKVGEDTGTQWKVDAHLEELDLHKITTQLGIEVNFIPPGSRWLAFSVTKVA